MKKIAIIIASIIVAALLIAGGIYVFFGGGNGGNGGGGNTAASGAGVDQVVPLSQVMPDAPTGQYLQIGTADGTVQVNNFYNANPMVTDGGTAVILASTTDYLITYDTTASDFWIGIEPAQWNAARGGAEQALLGVLGISQADACKLVVSESGFYSATSTIAGQSFPLSFCGANQL